MQSSHRPVTRRAAFRLGGAATLLTAAGLAGHAFLTRPDVDAYHPENERYFTTVNNNPANYHRNPTVEDAVRESDAVVVGEIVDVRTLGATIGESPDLVSPATGYVVRVTHVLHGTLSASDRERLTVHLQEGILGPLAGLATRSETAPRGLATWILRANRRTVDDDRRSLQLRGESSAQIAEWERWHAPAYTPAGACRAC